MFSLSLLDEGVGLTIVQDAGGTTGNTCDRLERALKSLNIVSPHEQLITYKDIEAWRQGGAETYVAVGEIVAQADEVSNTRRFIAKAVTTFPTRPERAMAIWEKRINLLTRLGVPMPFLYSTRQGVLYQEFLPQSLDGAWANADARQREAWSIELGAMAGVLDACGFQPIAFEHDLRIKNNKLFLVDVGSDIGSENLSSPGPITYGLLERSRHLSPQDLRAAEDEYTRTFERVRETIRHGLQYGP